jgi:peptidoglycan/LPS O-acetylase OafA/YrhL
VAGVALALLKNWHPAAWARLTAFGNRTLLAGIAGTALLFYVFLSDHYGYWVTVFGYPGLAVSFSVLLIAALSPGSVLYQRVPGAASLALWSYAIYLLHKQVCIVLRPMLQDLGHGPDGAPAILVSIAVSIATGWLLYRVVETPFMRLRARYARQSCLTAICRSHRVRVAYPPAIPGWHARAGSCLPAACCRSGCAGRARLPRCARWRRH